MLASGLLSRDPTPAAAHMRSPGGPTGDQTETPLLCRPFPPDRSSQSANAVSLWQGCDQGRHGQCSATEPVAHIRQSFHLNVSKGHESYRSAFGKNSPLIEGEVRIFSAHCSVYGNENRMC